MRAMLVLCAIAARTAADPRPELHPIADIGTVAAGATPGVWLVTTDGADAAYSFGRAILARGVTGTFTLSLRWRRLDADVSSSEIWLPSGAVILLRDGEVALWIDNASFDGFRPLPGYQTQRAARIEVMQGEAELVLRVDGAVAARWPRGPGPAVGTLAAALKSPPRRRVRLRLDEITLVHGQ